MQGLDNADHNDEDKDLASGADRERDVTDPIPCEGLELGVLLLSAEEPQRQSRGFVEGKRTCAVRMPQRLPTPAPPEDPAQDRGTPPSRTSVHIDRRSLSGAVSRVNGPSMKGRRTSEHIEHDSGIPLGRVFDTEPSERDTYSK
jgi:hypothetical protein